MFSSLLPRLRSRADGRGFTLMELLVVVVIIGILAAMVLARFQSARDKAAVAVMQSDLRNLYTQQELRINQDAGYTDDPEADIAGYHFSDGVTLTRSFATATSWAASLAHVETDQICTIAQIDETLIPVSCSADALTFDVSDPTPLAGFTVTFDASAAILAALAYAPETDGLFGNVVGTAFGAPSSVQTVAWNFGDGTSIAGPPATHAVVQHAFMTEHQEHTVSLTLVLDDGSLRTGSATVSVGALNQAPTAVLWLSADSVLIDSDILFRGTDSSDPEGYPLSFAWTFGDVGTADDSAGVHHYSTAGDKTVTLRVTDNGGLWDEATASVYVNPQRAPVASFTVSPDSIRIGESIAFNATASYDPEGLPLTYQWDFGDGATTSGPAPSHGYNTTGGDLTVRLIVTDVAGFADTATASVFVDSNYAPVAAITGATTDIAVGQSRKFIAASTDQNGDALTHSWRFTDTGETITADSVTHAFSVAGGTTVRLISTDPLGVADTATVSFSVVNVDATFTWSPSTPVYGSPVQFQATSQAYGSYSWQFGTGQTGTGGSPSHTYTSAGDYAVTLTVTTINGATKSHTETVHIATPPTVLFGPGPNLNSLDRFQFSVSGNSGTFISYEGRTSKTFTGMPCTVGTSSYKGGSTMITLSTSYQEYSYSYKDTCGGGYTYTVRLRLKAQDALAVGKTLNLWVSRYGTEARFGFGVDGYWPLYPPDGNASGQWLDFDYIYFERSAPGS